MHHKQTAVFLWSEIDWGIDFEPILSEKDMKQPRLKEVFCMRILVTGGGAGFIGSCFVRHILKKHKVINLDALTYCGNLENLKDVERNPDYEFVHGNICDKNL